MTGLDYQAQSEAISKRLGALGLDVAGAMLSEGFCPLCTGRSSQTPVCEPSSDDRPAASVVECQACRVSWRAGIHPENGMDWIEHKVPIDRVDMTATFAMCINAPPEPRDEDDWDDWREDPEEWADDDD